MPDTFVRIILNKSNYITRIVQLLNFLFNVQVIENRYVIFTVDSSHTLDDIDEIRLQVSCIVIDEFFRSTIHFIMFIGKVT